MADKAATPYAHIPVRAIPLTDIDEGSRLREDYGDVSALAESLLRYKQLQNICVLDKASAREQGIPFEESLLAAPYLLVSGGRRLRAAKVAGLETLNAGVFTHMPADDEIRTLELIENIHRKNLSFAEEAKMTAEIHRLQQKLAAEEGRTQTQKATGIILGVTDATVNRALKITKAIEKDPELAKAPDAATVLRTVEKRENDAIRAELVKRQLARMEQEKVGDKYAGRKKKMIESYMVTSLEEGCQRLPVNSIDFIEFDPPFGVKLNEVKKGDASTYKEIPDLDYVPWINNAAKEFFRVMKPNSWGVWWYSQKWHQETLDAIRAAGFSCYHIPLLWHKPGSQGQTQNTTFNLGNAYEIAFYFRKGQPRLLRAGAPNVFSYAPLHHSKQDHNTQRPIGLIQEILRTFVPAGSRVLVPCLGSGTTLLAASNENMDGFGFDIDPQYKPKYAERVLVQDPGHYTDPN